MMTDVAAALWTWTPYLAAGFGWNMIVSLAAMAIGTPIGLVLALSRASAGRGLTSSGGALTTLARAAPTFVMLFYLAYTVPSSVDLWGVVVIVPAWFKASRLRSRSPATSPTTRSPRCVICDAASARRRCCSCRPGPAIS